MEQSEGELCEGLESQRMGKIFNLNEAEESLEQQVRVTLMNSLQICDIRESLW